MDALVIGFLLAETVTSGRWLQWCVLMAVWSSIICYIVTTSVLKSLLSHLPLRLLGHIWDVMLVWRKGNIAKKKLSLCYSIVYYHNGAQRYEQFLQVGRLYQALILLDLALCLPSAFMVLFVGLLKNFPLTSFSLTFSELSLVGLALDLVD